MTSAGTWHVQPLPLRLTWQPPGDVQAGLCALACASLADHPSSIWGVADCESLIALRRVLAHLGVQFVRQDEQWLIVHPPHDGLVWSGAELDCGADIDTMLVALGVCAHVAGKEVQLRSSDACQHVAVAEACRIMRQLGLSLKAEAEASSCTLTLTRIGDIAAEVILAPSLHALKPMAMLTALSHQQEVSFLDHSSGPDHVERALQTLGLESQRDGRQLRFHGGRKLRGRTLRVPPDIAAAAPLILAVAAHREATRLDLPIVGVNPTRTSFLRCLTRTGAHVLRLRDWQFGNEPVAVLEVKGKAQLREFSIPPNAAPGMLIELLMLAAFASQCSGQTRIAGMAALRGGTPERLTLGLQMLRLYGVQAELEGSVLIVAGPTLLTPTELNCADDLLLGQLGLTLALLAGQPVRLHGMTAVDQRWPELQPICTRSGPTELFNSATDDPIEDNAGVEG